MKLRKKDNGTVRSLFGGILAFCLSLFLQLFCVAELMIRGGARENVTLFSVLFALVTSSMLGMYVTLKRVGAWRWSVVLMTSALVVLLLTAINIVVFGCEFQSVLRVVVATLLGSVMVCGVLKSGSSGRKITRSVKMYK